MSTPTTTATAEAIMAALLPLKDNPAYAAMSLEDRVAALDAALSPVGNIKAVGVAGGWWDLLVSWLADKIEQIEDAWDNLLDDLTDYLGDIYNAPWYWMPPLPVLPIPPSPSTGG